MTNSGLPAAAGTSNFPAPLRIPRLSVGRGFRFGNIDWFPVWTDATYTGSKATERTALRAHLPLTTLTSTQLTWDPELQQTRNLLVRQGAIVLGLALSTLVTSSSMLTPGQSTNAIMPMGPIELPTRAPQAGDVPPPGIDVPLEMRVAALELQRLPAGEFTLRDQTSFLLRFEKTMEAYDRYTRRHGLSGNLPVVEGLERAMDKLREQPLPKAKPIDGQRGVLVAINGEPAFIEVFEDSRLLKANLTQILEANLPDASLCDYTPCTSRQARRFAAAVESRGVPAVSPNGAAVSYSSRTVATAMVSGPETWAHLVSFNLANPVVRAAASA